MYLLTILTRIQFLQYQMHLQGGFGKAYKQKGVQQFYSEKGAVYSNPHAYDIQRVLRKKVGKPNPYVKANSKILDLACGAGQVAKPLLSFGYKSIRGTDPYTAVAFKNATKCQCDEFSFMNILQGCYDGQHFDCIISSYAMHLVKQSLLHDFCNKLSELADYLIIISPHKLPVMKQTFGWKEVESIVHEKIHFRAFKSTYQKEEQQLIEEEKTEPKRQTQLQQTQQGGKLQSSEGKDDQV